MRPATIFVPEVETGTDGTTESAGPVPCDPADTRSSAPRAFPAILCPEATHGALAPTPGGNVEHDESMPRGVAANVESRPCVAPFPRFAPLRESYALIQEWEGTVLEVRGTELVARLADPSSRGGKTKRALIPLRQVSDSDLDLLAPGAVFRWTFGYRIKSHGQRTLESSISFRRLPMWSERDIERARAAGSDLDELFDGDA